MGLEFIIEQDFFETYAEAILVTTGKHDPVYFNPAFSLLTGFGPGDLPLIPSESLLNPGQNSATAIKLGSYVTDAFKNKGGNPINLKVSLSEIPLSDGSTGIIYTLKENPVPGPTYEQGDDEIRRLTAEVKNLSEELDQFIYATSHDLQEPMRMIAAYVQLLEKNMEKGDIKSSREFMSFVLDGVSRMKGMMNDLLLFSRVNRSTGPAAPVDLNRVMKSVLSHLDEKIKSSGAIVRYGELPTVSADAHLLVQLFQNLIDNSIKFRSQAKVPEIDIRVTDEKEKYVFEVRDNGIGIDIKFHNRIFAIFQRLHQRSEYPGTGIGLSICKKIVERLGGEIWLESEPGKGSTFFFSIKKQLV